MNPIAPVSMLAGKGSGTAVAVFGVLVVLAMLARAKNPATSSDYRTA